MVRWILPYSCTTPLGFPVEPEVYTANAAAWSSGSAISREGAYC